MSKIREFFEIAFCLALISAWYAVDYFKYGILKMSYDE